MNYRATDEGNYRTTDERAKQKFPISDYIRLSVMGLVILLTILVIKIGGFLSTMRKTAPAIEGQQTVGRGLSFTQGPGDLRGL
jgi:hypothetical protein